MTSYQRAKRYAIWRMFGGGLLAISAAILWILASGIAGHITG